MYKAERQILKHNIQELEQACHLSKNLYNRANYCFRQSFVKTGKKISYFELRNKFRKRNNYDFRNLPSVCGDLIIKLLDKNWKSFFSSIKDYKKNPNKYSGRPKMPKYKDKNGKNIIIFDKNGARIKNGYIYFAKNIISPIKTNVKQEDFVEVRIVPQATCFVAEIVYKKEIIKNENLDENKFLAIDLGLNNLVTSINNVGKKPFIINGKQLKSINQFYNKKRAKLMSYVGNRGTSNKIKRLTLKRNNKISNYLHHVSKYIENYCLDNNIGMVIIGNNKNWKQEINIGKQNNQNFVSVPHSTLISQIKYKCEQHGIKVIETEESYTSKVDHLANEEMIKKDIYLGKRLKRGLFQSSTNKLVNADINGAIGITKKVISDFDISQIVDRGFMFNPLKINLLKNNFYKGTFNNIFHNISS